MCAGLTPYDPHCHLQSFQQFHGQLDPDGRSTAVLQNVGQCVCSDTVSDLRGLESSYLYSPPKHVHTLIAGGVWSPCSLLYSLYSNS
jgi:hypothetical protein